MYNCTVCTTFLSVLAGELQKHFMAGANMGPKKSVSREVFTYCIHRFGHSLVTSIVNKLEAKSSGNPLNTTTFKLEDNFFMIEYE